MHKFIKIKQSTYDELVKDATYQDTMDCIIQRVLNYSKLYKLNKKSLDSEENMI